MNIAELTPFYSVAPQVGEVDVGELTARGFRTVINNRPDGESEDQPDSDSLAAAAERVGLDYHHIPVVAGKISAEDVERFTEIMAKVRGPVLAFCRTGNRSVSLWALSEAAHLAPDALLRAAAKAGYEIDSLGPRIEERWREGLPGKKSAGGGYASRSYDVVVVGGGAAGIAVSSSLLRRRPGLKLAIVEPRDKHFYQPGWTLVGAGCFDRAKTERSMDSCMPQGVTWMRAAAAEFQPEHNRVVLEDGAGVEYRTLVVCPGIKLDWDAVEGLRDTLGKNGVTSNYLFDMASYTRELMASMRSGTALFTQPPMPIKCAGAPQKAMYLLCDHWRSKGVLDQINVEFNNAGGVLFGVQAFVPNLMRYVERYGAGLAFNSNLKAIDGPAKTAWFNVTDGDGASRRVEKHFDFIHVVPPQTAPDFVRSSPLADKAGWVEVSPETLRHPRYGNVFGLGDACSAPNAKTAAAIRKQAPVVAENLLAVLDGRGGRAIYDGYGSCPLTVERGRVILAEFGYGGKLTPSIPWDPTKPRRSAWFAKTQVLPYLYWDVMLKGREWLAKPERLPHEPAGHAVEDACKSTPETTAGRG